MKVDNKLAISLPVYLKSVRKWKYVLKKKMTKKTVKGKFPMAGVESRSDGVQGQ